MTFTNILLIFAVCFSGLFFYLHREKYPTNQNLKYSFLFIISIFLTFSILALISFLFFFIGFSLWESAAIGIIGAADGPSTIFVGNKFASRMLESFAFPLILILSLFSIIFFIFYNYFKYSFTKSTLYSLIAAIICCILISFFFVYYLSSSFFEDSSAIGIIGEPALSTLLYLMIPILLPLIFPLLVAFLFALIFFKTNPKEASRPHKIFFFAFLIFLTTGLLSLIILIIGEIGFSIVAFSAIGIVGVGDGPSTIYVGNKMISSFAKPVTLFLSNILALFLFWRNRFKYSTRKNLTYSFSFAFFSLFIILFLVFFFENAFLYYRMNN